MIRVDFYLLENQTANGIYPFACRLLEKIYKQGLQTFVAFNSLEESKQFDNLLWTFNDISFIPHALKQDTIASETPIILGLPNEFSSQKIYLNFCHDVYHYNAQKETTLERIIEIVPNEPNWRHAAREKFKAYKTEGLELHTHKL